MFNIKKFVEKKIKEILVKREVKTRLAKIARSEAQASFFLLARFTHTIMKGVISYEFAKKDILE